MAVKGVFASDAGIQGGNTGDFASGLLTVMPTGSAQLLALSSGMQSADAHDIAIHWFEERHMTGRVVVNGAVGGGAGDTGITVDDASEIVEGSVLMHETTGEYVFVESVSGFVLTVTRGLGDAASITAMADNSALQKIGTAHEEGSAKPTSIANLGSPVFNYMQNFRDSWDVTGTAKAVNYHTGNLAAKAEADAGGLHGESIERSIIWGKRAIGVRNSKAFRTMNGVVNMLSTNVQAQGANTTWTIVDQFLQDVFAKNIKGKPNERIAYCGNTVVGVFNRIAQLEGQIQLEVGQTDFGLNVTNWKTPYGNISLMTHPLFNENAVLSKNLLVLHPGAVRMRYLRRTFTDRYDKDGQRAGVDADFGVITTEMSMEYRAEETGGYFTGIDTAAAA